VVGTLQEINKQVDRILGDEVIKFLFRIHRTG